jgi:hypothetical protein
VQDSLSLANRHIETDADRFAVTDSVPTDTVVSGDIAISQDGSGDDPQPTEHTVPESDSEVATSVDHCGEYPTPNEVSDSNSEDD